MVLAKREAGSLGWDEEMAIELEAAIEAIEAKLANNETLTASEQEKLDRYHDSK